MFACPALSTTMLPFGADYTPPKIAQPSVVVRTDFFADSRSLSLAAKYTCAFQWQFGAACWGAWYGHFY
jgi:hypothetical protein